MITRAPIWTWRCQEDPGDPLLTLCADGSCALIMLSLYGQAIPSGADDAFSLSLSMDNDKAGEFADWLYEFLTTAPLPGRAIFTLRTGEVVGIETDDGLAFSLLGGDRVARDWTIHWLKRVSVSRADLDRLVDALTLLLQAHGLASAREASR